MQIKPSRQCPQIRCHPRLSVVPRSASFCHVSTSEKDLELLAKCFTLFENLKNSKELKRDAAPPRQERAAAPLSYHRGVPYGFFPAGKMLFRGF